MSDNNFSLFSPDNSLVGQKFLISLGVGLTPGSAPETMQQAPLQYVQQYKAKNTPKIKIRETHGVHTGDPFTWEVQHSSTACSKQIHKPKQTTRARRFTTKENTLKQTRLEEGKNSHVWERVFARGLPTRMHRCV